LINCARFQGSLSRSFRRPSALHWGRVGYFGYDLVRQFEKIPSRTADDLHLDDFQIMYYSTLLAFDHLRHRIFIIANILAELGSQSLEAKYQDALQRIDQVERRLTAPISLPAPAPVPRCRNRFPT